jgi:hypothetical protein
MGLEGPITPAVSSKQEKTVCGITNATSGVTTHYQVRAAVMIHIPQATPGECS